MTISKAENFVAVGRASKGNGKYVKLLREFYDSGEKCVRVEDLGEVKMRSAYTLFFKYAKEYFENEIRVVAKEDKIYFIRKDC